MKTILKSTALLGALFVSANASAATTFISGNSLFEWVDNQSALTWSDANTLASAKTYVGTVNGSAQLATFDSVAQMNDIFANISILYSNQSSGWQYGDWSFGGWVGATATTSGTNDTAQWIDSTASNVQDFFVINDINPNGNGPGVTIAKLVKKDETLFGLDDFGSNGTGYGDVNVSSYLVEYTLAPVPVPAAAFLFAPALVGFMAMRRKAAKKA